jgi:hypothetical protein
MERSNTHKEKGLKSYLETRTQGNYEIINLFRNLIWTFPIKKLARSSEHSTAKTFRAKNF